MVKEGLYLLSKPLAAKMALIYLRAPTASIRPVTPLPDPRGRSETSLLQMKSPYLKKRGSIH